MADVLTVYDASTDALSEALEAAALRAVADSSAYTRAARAFFDFAYARGLPLAEVATVRAWVGSLRDSYAPASLVPMLSAVKKALRGAAQELASAKEAAAFSEALRTVKPPKRATKAIRRDFMLSSEEEEKVLRLMSSRDAALFAFLLRTGARISEALGIRLEQCKAEGAIVICPVLGKGNKARELRVAAELFAQVRAAFPGDTWLFETTGGKPMRRTYAAERISGEVFKATEKHFSPHCARHTFATRALERTGKIKAVSEYLGHSSASTTLDMYTHEELSDADLAEV
jgi:integrase/recombinase XerD